MGVLNQKPDYGLQNMTPEEVLAGRRQAFSSCSLGKIVWGSGQVTMTLMTGHTCTQRPALAVTSQEVLEVVVNATSLLLSHL